MPIADDVWSQPGHAGVRVYCRICVGNPDFENVGEAFHHYWNFHRPHGQNPDIINVEQYGMPAGPVGEHAARAPRKPRKKKIKVYTGEDPAEA